MSIKSRDEAVKRYGAIDFSSKYWHDQSKWLQMLEIPHDWFPNWVVGGTKIPVHHIAANIDIHKPLFSALEAVKNGGMKDLLKTFDGCFNIRMVRGSNTHFSAHAYGLAVDLNCEDNWLGSIHGGFYNHPEFVKCFTDAGFSWGGNFHGRRDPMHFSLCWE